MRSRTIAVGALGALAVCCLLQHRRQRQESAKAPGRTTISFYGQDAQDDNGVGYAGVTLKAFGTTPLRWRGSRVYPIAVAQKDWKRYAYKVLRISGPGLRPILGVVVDLCAANNSNCKNNVQTYNFLVDVHKTAFGAIGMSDGLVQGSFEVVGSMSAASFPPSYWQPTVRSGSESLQCRTGGSKLEWVSLRQVSRCM